MFRFLARFLKSGGPRSSAKPSTQKFAPRLESLDGRALPSVMAPGIDDGGGLTVGVLNSGPISVVENGGASDTVVVSGGSVGGVIPAGAGSPLGDVSALGTRKVGDEIPGTPNCMEAAQKYGVLGERKAGNEILAGVGGGAASGGKSSPILMVADGIGEEIPQKSK